MEKTGWPSILKLLTQLLLVVIIFPFLPLLLTLRWDWWEAWAYALLWVLTFVFSRVLASRFHPDLLAERAKMIAHENTVSWDRKLTVIVGLGIVFVPLTVGLDARLGASTGFGLSIKLAALVVMTGGYLFSSWALVVNRFFSGVVRLQPERGHQVVSSGPYRFVRHPGYVGAMLSYLATPFLLDSTWALMPAVLLCAVLVYRTVLEDRFLQENLAGYREYAATTRYRLLPGIW